MNRDHKYFKTKCSGKYIDITEIISWDWRILINYELCYVIPCSRRVFLEKLIVTHLVKNFIACMRHTDGHYYVHKCVLLGTTLDQLYLLHRLIICFIDIHFNIIFHRSAK
jgi:hypothetical protein